MEFYEASDSGWRWIKVDYLPFFVFLDQVSTGVDSVSNVFLDQVRTGVDSVSNVFLVFVGVVFICNSTGVIVTKILFYGGISLLVQ